MRDYCTINTNTILYKELKENANYYGLSPKIFEYDKYLIDGNFNVSKSILSKVKDIIDKYGDTKTAIKKEGEKEAYIPISTKEFFIVYYFPSFFGYKKSDINNSKNYLGNLFISQQNKLDKMTMVAASDYLETHHNKLYQGFIEDYNTNTFVLRDSLHRQYYVGNSKLLKDVSIMDCPAPLARIPKKYVDFINNNKIDIKKLSKNATIPKTATDGSAGYDLYAAYDGVVKSREKALIKTDIAMKIPKKYYGRVAPRSGLTQKHGIDVGAGVIDSDYRGNIGIILFNHSDTDFKVKKGDRIAQLIFELIWKPFTFEVDSLDDTVRGSGGFGSTGGK